MAKECKTLLVVTSFLFAAAVSNILYQVPVYRMSMNIKTSNPSLTIQLLDGIVESLPSCEDFHIFAENGAFVLRARTNGNRLDLGSQCHGQVARLLGGNAVMVTALEVVRLNKINPFRYFLFTLLLFALIWSVASFRGRAK